MNEGGNSGDNVADNEHIYNNCSIQGLHHQRMERTLASYDLGIFHRIQQIARQGPGNYALVALVSGNLW